MRIMLFVLCACILGSSPSFAQTCSQQVIQQLRQRGLSPQAIEQMCGAQPGATRAATVCVTQFGSCPFQGPAKAPCSCRTQFGTMRGVSR